MVLTGLCSLAELATTALFLNVIRLATQSAGSGSRALLPWATEAPLLLVGASTAALVTAVVVAVFLLRAALTLALTAAASSATVETGIVIGEALLWAYVSMPYARFRQRRVADLQRRVSQLATLVAWQVFRPGVQFLTDAAVIASILSVMVVASPWGTLAAAAFVAGVIVVLVRAVNPRLHEATALIERHDRSANLFVDQVLQGRREITLRHHEAPVVSSHREERAKVAAANRYRAILVDLPRIVIEGVTMILVASLIIFTIGLEYDTPRVLTMLGLFAYALVRLLPLAGRSATNLANVRAGLPFVDQVLQDVPVRGAAGPRYTGGTGPAKRPPVLNVAIEFWRVSSWYEESKRPALRDVTVRIEAGSFVGIVGPSGAGKSTFVDLLVGLLEPTSGEVLLDGRPLGGLEPGWQAGVGVVSQEPYIFNDSILRNVVLFADAIDEDRVEHVLEEVGLWELVQQLPRGLHTQLGERGSALSGGQRQRLAVARALYSDPSLLVLDEATSALDPYGEATVIRAALRRDQPRTVVAVTHRASAIAGCDQIIVLEDGMVTAAGSYADVVEKSAYFARLVSPLVPDSSG